MGYTPMDYYDLGEYRQWIQVWDERAKTLVWFQHSGTSTLWGSTTELKDLITAFRNNGIVCIADIVINHRDPQQVNAHDEWVSWGSDDHCVESKKMVWGYKGKDDDPEQISYQCGGAGQDDGEGGFSSNIAHGSAMARSDIKQWLLWMKETIGFGGWRYDYVKGFAPERIAEYNYHTGSLFSVGEFWDTNTQLVYNWIDRTDAYSVARKSRAFDFALQEHLRQIFWGVKPFDQLGLWKYSSVSVVGGWADKAVTFLDNHDTARKAFNDFPTDEKRLLQGYVFLLTHPGCPCTFHSHFFEKTSSLREKISRLCRLRHQKNISSTSKAEVVRATSACYAARIDNCVIVKIGDELWSPPGNPTLEMSGDGFAIWSI